MKSKLIQIPYTVAIIKPHLALKGTVVSKTDSDVSFSLVRINI